MTPRYALVTPEGIRVTDQKPPEKTINRSMCRRWKDNDGLCDSKGCYFIGSGLKTCHDEELYRWQQSTVLVEDQKEITRLITGFHFDEGSGYWFNAGLTKISSDPLRDKKPGTIIGPLELPEGEVVELCCTPSHGFPSEVCQQKCNKLRQVFRFKPQK